MTRHRVKRCLRTDKAIDLGELLRSVILARGSYLQTHRPDGMSFAGYRGPLVMGLLLVGPIPEASTGEKLEMHFGMKQKTLSAGLFGSHNL